MSASSTTAPDLASYASRDSWLHLLLLLLGGVALVRALEHDGDVRFLWLALALLACAGAVVLPAFRSLDCLLMPLAAPLSALALAIQLYHTWDKPLHYQLGLRDPAMLVPFAAYQYAALVAGAAALVLGLWVTRSRPLLWLPPLIAVHLLLGAWVIEHARERHNDVIIFHQDALAALLRGENPYAMTFPDIYSAQQLPFYGEGLSVNGRLLFGFPYPPLSLLLALPGYLLAGDSRYSQLLALALAALLMALSGRGRLGLAAATLFLFTPRIFHVLEQSWTEPFAVLLLAATVYSACRAPRALALALGLLLAVKQYMIFVAPLAMLLMGASDPARRWGDYWRLLLRAGLVAAIVSLPMMLWDPRAFIQDVVLLQFRQPFRSDSLSYLAWLARSQGLQISAWPSFVATLLALALARWRAPRTPAGFASAVALTYLVFFSFNKQAFLNYYFFVIGAICCALATMGSAPALAQPQPQSSGVSGPARRLVARWSRWSQP